MPPSAATFLPIATFRKPTIRSTAVLLLAAWLIPFVIHLLPWSGSRPLGAYLLPMFWATFVAAYLYGLRLGLLVGLFAPALNLLITGLPAAKFLGVLSVELVVFACVTSWAVGRFPRLLLVAPLGYLVAKIASTTLQVTTGVLGDIGDPLNFLGHSVVGGLAGLVVLAAINGVLVWNYPRRTVEADDTGAV